MAVNTGSSVELIKRLFSENFRGNIRIYLIAAVLMIISAVATAGAAWMMRDIVNEIFLDQNRAMLVPIAVTVMVIFVIKGLSTYGHMVLLAKIGADVVAKLQRRLVTKILGQGLAYFDANSSADLSTRVSVHARLARNVVRIVSVTMVKDTVTVFALVVVMLLQDWRMTLILLVLGPIGIVGVARLIKRVKAIMAADVLNISQAVGLLNQSVQGVRTVKSYGMEELQEKQINSTIGKMQRRAVKVARMDAVTQPLAEVLGGFGVALIILYGGYQIMEHGADPGGFFAIITAFLMAHEPAKRIARMNIQLETSLTGVRAVYHTLDQPTRLLDAPNATDLTMADGRIEFAEVDFDYGKKPALHNVSFTAEPGQITALVGKSGSGKSTVFSLINRFYDIKSGAVTIDGQNVADVTQKSLRQNITYVTQDPFLFEGTVRDNILCGKPEATEDELAAAIRDANVEEFLDLLPKGLDSPVGERGTLLSGGQRQRVAIARSMLKDAPIILLDEATSALDAESEAMVQEALGRLMKGRTALVIAHRLATISGADKIVILDRGKVVETGNHSDLVAHGGIYKNFVDLQVAE